MRGLELKGDIPWNKKDKESEKGINPREGIGTFSFQTSNNVSISCEKGINPREGIGTLECVEILNEGKIR